MDTTLLNQPSCIFIPPISPNIIANILSFLPVDNDFFPMKLVSREWNKQARLLPQRKLHLLLKDLEAQASTDLRSTVEDKVASIRSMIIRIEKSSYYARKFINDKESHNQLLSIYLIPNSIINCFIIYYTLVGQEVYENWSCLRDCIRKVDESVHLKTIDYYKTVDSEKLSEVRKEVQERRINLDTLAKESPGLADLYQWILATLKCAEVNLSLDEQTKRIVEFLISDKMINQLKRSRSRVSLLDRNIRLQKNAQV